MFRIAQRLPSPISAPFSHYLTPLTQRFSSLYRRIGSLLSSAEKAIAPTCLQTRTFVWQRKKEIASTFALVVVAWKVALWYKNRPLYPAANLQTSLLTGCLTIQTPLPNEFPKVAIVICADCSGSMDGQRAENVRAGINKILSSATLIKQSFPSSFFSFAIVSFNAEAHTLCPPIELNEENLGGIRKGANSYHASGRTNIMAGLNMAIQQVETLASKNREAKPLLIFLSDGEANEQLAGLEAVQQRLAAVCGQLFAIGIGKNHNKAVLQQVAGAKGSYIDTTQRGQTIDGAIFSIYGGAVGAFKSFSLSPSEGFPKNAYLVNGYPVANENCPLTAPPRGGALQVKITLLPQQMPDRFSLRDLVFTLQFTDPSGKQGELRLSWPLDPIVRRDIIDFQPSP